MATKNNRRKQYANATQGYTSIDLSRVCAFTSTSPIDGQWLVDFHMDSGTIFSVRMDDTERGELTKMWAYWRDE